MWELRPAREDEAASIAALFDLCCSLAARVPPRADDLLLVATHGAHIAAAACFRPLDPHHGWIYGLAVRPGFRKQRLARKLYQRLLDEAGRRRLSHLYATASAGSSYFQALGFNVAPEAGHPALHPVLNQALSEYGLHDDDAVVLHQPLLQPEGISPAGEATALFDAGYFCAESVLLATARATGLDEPGLARLATGFCTGMAQTWNTCGALSGGVLAVNLACGRDLPSESVSANFHAVQRLTREFTSACGGCRCSELNGFDLSTPAGRHAWAQDGGHAQCREYVAIAARLATAVIREARQEDEARGGLLNLFPAGDEEERRLPAG
ncbi:C-GCAxxG-C-C family (seleno)protein [Oryzomicrobium sp.]|uniref:C-GCAxxG-C-C family (seleno)protein n=1 Tax=Oryzomicrobium sp. TaxID=1911578 RepID=UPI0025EB5D8C|nr:C-GCAxxG-C-C family (seleno)protein [Oryzomicrobium sp.]MCE1244475.1 GNAT family N-acetyltransferase [Oryzomicrobium sp.]